MAASTVVYFLDRDTGNKVGSGLTVTIYAQNAQQIPANVITTGTTDANGAAILTLNNSTAYTATFSGAGAPAYGYNFTTGAQSQVVYPTPQRGKKTGAKADGNTTAITFSPAFSTSVDEILFSIGANYNGGDNAALSIRLDNANPPTLTQFNVIVSGGTSGSTVDVHWAAFGE